MDAWFCEYAGHRGERGESAVHPRDRFTKRETYMRADGQQRLHERSVMHICKPCIALDTGERSRDQLELLT